MKFFTGSSLEPKGVLVDWLLKYSDTNLTNIITHAYSPPFAFNQEEIHLTLAALFIQGQIEFHKIDNAIQNCKKNLENHLGIDNMFIFFIFRTKKHIQPQKIKDFLIKKFFLFFKICM